MADWIQYCEQYIPRLKERYFKKCGKQLDIDNPKSFTEKVQWLKIYDSAFLKSYCADKINLHHYSLKTLGYDYCIPITSTFNSIDDIDFNRLPARFVLKCNHGSGYNIICKDKTKLNQSRTISLLRQWLNEDYSEKQGYELHYKLIQPKCFSEQYMNDGHSDLTDYKIYCFNGRDIFTQVIQDRNTNELMSHFLPGWVYTDKYDQVGYNSSPSIEPPRCYDKMIHMARTLSKPFKMVRVDFYVIHDTLYLGELTFTPYSGYHRFKSSTADNELGELLSI